MIRWLVATAFLVASAGTILAAFMVGPETGSGTLLVNLGTEIFGILITVAVVEWLFERRRLQDRAREQAWNVLHGLERAVWVWQGGPRRIGTEELLGLISGIRSSDTLARTTRTLLVNLGTQSRDLLDRESNAVRTLPGLQGALEDLASLRSLRDGDSAVSVRMVSEILESAVQGLARVLGLSAQRIPAGLIRRRDADTGAQEQRYYDLLPGAAHTPAPPGPDDVEPQLGVSG